MIKNNERAETRGVRLYKHHVEWIDDKAINLSQWVRNKIDQELKKSEVNV